ncbi:MAG TPA: DUF167 domain-containing protein [Rhizobiales bacterium]|nr:DUF167 domain-containing protein [Hyphomicrobiales bacterium]
MWRVTKTGGILRVRATPKSSRDEITGIHEAADGALSLKVAVRAQPEKGKANKAVIAVLSKRLKIARSQFEVASGNTARQKTIAITGDPALLKNRIAAFIEDMKNG